MKSKKNFLAFFSLLLVGVMLFSACNAGGSGKAKTTETSAEGLSAPGEFPITKEVTSLRVLIQNSALVEDFATNEFTKWYEEKTNIKVEWELLPVVEGGTKLNLILAGGEYPDVIMNIAGNVTSSQIMSYASQGLFLPLNDLIDANAPQLTAMFEAEETSFLRPMITYPDQEIYYFPDINQCYHCSIGQKMWINKPWLDTLGLEMPTNTEEFADMLRAFRDKDPNGNGIADEIPYSSGKTFHPGFLMSPFAFNNNSTGLYLVDGKVTTDIASDGWRDGLRYQRALFEEDLIAPEAFTQDWEQIRQQGEHPDTAILGAADGLHTGMFTQLYGESGRWLEYEILPPIKVQNGKEPILHRDPYQSNADTVITDKAENPALAAKWIDGLYEIEATMRAIYGRPDEEWIWAEEGDMGIDSKPALFKLLVPWSEEIQNINWAQAGPHARTNTFRMGETVKAEDPLESILYEATKIYEPFTFGLDQILPPVVFSDEQAEELATIEKPLTDFIRESCAAFIMGDRDIETEWDAYIAELEGIGLARYLEINQNSYDEKYGKK